MTILHNAGCSRERPSVVKTHASAQSCRQTQESNRTQEAEPMGTIGARRPQFGAVQEPRPNRFVAVAVDGKVTVYEVAEKVRSARTRELSALEAQIRGFVGERSPSVTGSSLQTDKTQFVNAAPLQRTNSRCERAQIPPCRPGPPSGEFSLALCPSYLSFAGKWKYAH
jgi:hypothetical protein